MVVADVLGGDAETVGNVEHKAGHAVVGGDEGGVDAELGALVVAHYDFFAPVAEDVGREARILLGTVVEATSFGTEVK